VVKRLVIMVAISGVSEYELHSVNNGWLDGTLMKLTNTQETGCKSVTKPSKMNRVERVVFL